MWFLRRSCAISRTGVFAVVEITGLVITSRAFMTATYNVELVKTGTERRTKEGGNRKLGLRCSIDVRRRRVRVDPCRPARAGRRRAHRFTSRSWQRRCAPLAAKSAGRSSESDLRAGLDPVLRPREAPRGGPWQARAAGGSGSAICLWRSGAARAILALVIIESVTHGPRRLAGPARRSRADARHRVRAVRRGRYNVGGSSRSMGRT